mgnify:CR=1 FL=1
MASGVSCHGWGCVDSIPSTELPATDSAIFHPNLLGVKDVK